MLKEEEEHELIFKLASFPELILNSTMLQYAPLVLKYLEELTRGSIFIGFIQNAKVLSDDKDLTLARLLLVSSSKNRYKKRFRICGYFHT